jgi:hypothetical protein
MPAAPACGSSPCRRRHAPCFACGRHRPRTPARSRGPHPLPGAEARRPPANTTPARAMPGPLPRLPAGGVCSLGTARASRIRRPSPPDGGQKPGRRRAATPLCAARVSFNPGASWGRAVQVPGRPIRRRLARPHPAQLPVGAPSPPRPQAGHPRTPRKGFVHASSGRTLALACTCLSYVRAGGGTTWGLRPQTPLLAALRAANPERHPPMEPTKLCPIDRTPIYDDAPTCSLPCLIELRDQRAARRQRAELVSALPLPWPPPPPPPLLDKAPKKPKRRR